MRMAVPLYGIIQYLDIAGVILVAIDKKVMHFRTRN